MSLYAKLKPKGPNGFGYGSTAEEVTAGLDLSGKTILVTGCNSGLGRETARVLALRGARVIGTARSVEKARLPFEGTVPLACELADPASVRACVESVKALGVPLDAVICNAGIMAPPQRQQAFGYELQFFTNHLGHFMLVTGLLDSLAEAGRVVMLSSGAHWMAPEEGIQFDNLSGDQGYKPMTAYGQSKFANLLFAKELARRMEGSSRVAMAVHPGVIQTNLFKGGPWLSLAMSLIGPLALKSIPQGTATTCYAAVHPRAASLSGAYLVDVNPARCRADGNDKELARKLWETSEQIVRDLPVTAS